jgi:hypothetical protein
LIWAWGFRNPFRIQVDPATGDVFIADVGWNTWEEVSQATEGGQNFSWPGFEANMPYLTCPRVGPDTPPIYAVNHTEGWAAVMVAGVYRRPPGANRPFPVEYEGDLFLSDYYATVMRRLRRNGKSWSVAPPVAGQPSLVNWASGLWTVPDYAISPDGSLWYSRMGPVGPSLGEIRRIVHDNRILISNVIAAEGNLGMSSFEFTVKLSVPIDQDVTVDFATADGSATVLDLDYLNTSGTLTIPANSETATLTIPVIGDLTPEGPQTFFVNLSNPSAGVLADAQGQGTILDDDGVTGTEDLIVTDLVLEYVRPNPARSIAHVDFAIPREAHVRLSVVDLQGREVAVLVDDKRSAGRHSATWKGRKSPGVYFSRLEYGATVRTRKFLVLE